MPETPPSFESSEISKGRVIAAYKPFLERGVFSPYDLDLEDPAVVAADDLFASWRDAMAAQVIEGDVESLRLARLEVQTFFVDMGFVDPTYLKEVRDEITGAVEYDFLKEEPDSSAVPVSIQRIRAKLAEIENLFSVRPAAEGQAESLETISDEALLHLLEHDQDRQRERPVKEATFRWFMRRLEAIEAAENPQAGKDAFKAEITDLMRNKFGWFEWLFTLSLVYLQGKEPRAIDRQLLKELTR